VVDEENPMIKYQLLNPATNFQEIVQCARSIILAGGTMSPVIPSNELGNLFSIILVADIRNHKPAVHKPRSPDVICFFL
jgi:hypothetical protein